MRRPLRIFSCAFAAAVATSALAAGPAFAAGNSVPPASHATAIATHGLGARRPTARLAPRTSGFSALDVLPASVDLKQWAVTPGNQGAVSSCVTWAIDYGMLGWYSKYSGRTSQLFAPMYTYSQINGGVDAGSYPTAALQVAKTQGSDTRAHYTQGDYDWRTKPTAAETANAANYKIQGYTTLFVGSGQAGSATLIKQALAAKHPVAVEMAVRSGFDYLGANPAAVDDDITGTVRGYHEVLAVGYDAAGLVIENSWGTGWANGGFGRISWRVVLKDVWEAETIDGFAAPAVPLTPPTVTAPRVAVVSTHGTGARTSVTYNVNWNGKSGTSGAIKRYEAWYSVDGGKLHAVKLSAVRSTFRLSTKAGHTYKVGVRANAETMASAIVYGPAFAPAAAKAKTTPKR